MLPAVLEGYTDLLDTKTKIVDKEVLASILRKIAGVKMICLDEKLWQNPETARQVEGDKVAKDE